MASFKDVTIEYSTDGNTWTVLPGVPEFAQAPGDPNYVHNTTVDFGGVTAKYVRLNINTNWSDGTKQAGLSEVRFFTIPVKAYGPTPASGTTDLALDAVLNWRPGREAVRHDVYIGTDPNAVANGTVPVKTVTEHSLALGSLALEYNRTYYWKVNEVHDAATPKSWEGTVWSFTTIGYAVVDDFEKYDDLCNRIFWSWVDQYGYNATPECGGASAAGNGTGPTVGNAQAPYAEQTIVHASTQSMPLGFDNTKGPYYSEAQREWTSPQIWTGGGVNTLRVYLRGDAAAFVETSPGTIVMNGTGTDIWATLDQCRFAYKTLIGNGSIVDGVTWSNITTDAAASTVTVTLANEVCIGLAVTSHLAGAVCGARFSNVSTTGSASGAWQMAEIGVAQVNGNIPETFYVAVQDNAGKLKVVSHLDPGIISTGAWEEWNIPLSQFTSAGVSLNSVKKILVGVGDRSSPKPGNSGKVYIDDIRLTRMATP